MKLDAEYVRSILDYTPETGVFRWKHRDDVGDRWNVRWAGKVAGAVSVRGYVIIGIKYYRHFASRLAWAIVHGEWPTQQITYRDGDRTNIRIANLQLCAARQRKTSVKKELS